MGEISLCIYLKDAKQTAQEAVLYAYDNYEIYFQSFPEHGGWFLIEGEKLQVSEPIMKKCSNCGVWYREVRQRIIIVCRKIRRIKRYQKVATVQYIGRILRTSLESQNCYQYVTREKNSQYSNIVTDYRQVRKDHIFLEKGMHIWVDGLWILQRWQENSSCLVCQKVNVRTCMRELVYPVQEKIIFKNGG